jgi:hypothetical protein
MKGQRIKGAKGQSVRKKPPFLPAFSSPEVTDLVMSGLSVTTGNYTRRDFMKKVSALLLFMAIVLFPGCNSGTGNKSGDSGGADTASAYLPFKTGNSWTYATTEDTGSSFRTATIIGNTAIENRIYWMMKSVTTGSASDTTYFRIDGNTLYSFLDPSLLSDLITLPAINAMIIPSCKPSVEEIRMEMTIAKFGVAAGTVWTIYEVSYTANYTISIQGKYIGLETVSTPAGVFSNCAMFETTYSYSGKGDGINFSNTLTDCRWFAPHTGQVKETTVSQFISGGRSLFSSTGTDTLNSYTVR